MTVAVSVKVMQSSVEALKQEKQLPKHKKVHLS